MTAFVNGGITDTAKKSNLDTKYGPYESVHAAYTALTSPTDYVVVGLTVGIQTNDGIVEYWFQNGTSESDLVLKVPTVNVPVQSVNSKTGTVVLDHTDVGAAATEHTHTVSEITDFPNLATVATSGNYSDLNGTPTLATVATSGSYEDLTNKPTIPAAQVQTDWEAESGISSIAHKPTLATVATSGDYGDLINKPEIPAAQVQSDWNQTDSSKKDFIKNKPNIPSGQVQADWTEADNTALSYIKHKPTLATVATSGDYGDLINRPTIPAAQVQTDWNAVSGMGVLLNKPNLATVATSGDYNDLLNRPTIPAAQVQADWNESDSSSVSYIANKPTIPAAQIQSDWTQTNSSAPDYIKNKPNIVGAVQSDWDETDPSDPSYIRNKPAIVGQAQSDWTETDTSDPAYILHKPTLASVATSGDYDDLINKPSIPAAQVQTDWNAVSGMGVLLNKPTLATVATTGDYTDLTNTPTIPTSVTDLSDAGDYVTYSDLPYQNEFLGDLYVKNTVEDPSPGEVSETVALTTGEGEFSLTYISEEYGESPVETQLMYFEKSTGGLEVYPDTTFSGSTSGISYNDLDDKPTIPAAQVQTDWNAVSGMGVLLNKPNLATVATTGAYSDLSGTPTLATVATSGDYDDLTNKPTIPAAQVQTDWNAVSGMGVLLNKPNLATVATTGSYTDLSNKPTIPTAVADLSDASDYVTYEELPYQNEFLGDLYVKNPIEDPQTGEVTVDETIALNTGEGEFSLTYISEEIGESPVETQIMYFEKSTGGLEVYPDITFSGSTSGISYNDLDDKPTIPSISGCEVTSNKVTSLSAQSTDTQYPSAKCVYDIVGNIESTLNTILGV